MSEWTSDRELCPGLYAGSLWDLRELLGMKPDVIVVLDRLPARVWEEGFLGELLYYPIEEYGVLPAIILDRATQEIVARVQGGRRVVLFSREDCGRIGYVAACALFRLGVRESVHHLRRNYNIHVLEDDIQYREVEAFCHRHVAETYRDCVQRIEHIQIDSIEAFTNDREIMREYERISEELGDKARILLRFSGVLPSVRVMVEAATDGFCERCIDAFIGVVKRRGHFVDYVRDW